MTSNDNEYYVYRLIDPRTKYTFYVGKGKGERVHAHVRDALKNYNGVDYTNSIEAKRELEDEASLKISLIREILGQGLEVEVIIHRSGLDENTAYEVEAALIDAYPGLTNGTKGHGSRHRGSTLLISGKTKSVIISKPKAQKISVVPKHSIDGSNVIIEIKHKCIIIKIQQIRVDINNGDILKTVHRCWKNNKEKAEQANYVFAVINGVVKKIYKPIIWFNTYNETECKLSKCEKIKYCIRKSRIGFNGKEIDENDIKHLYLNKLIPYEYRKKGMAAPFLFTY